MAEEEQRWEPSLLGLPPKVKKQIFITLFEKATIFLQLPGMYREEYNRTGRFMFLTDPRNAMGLLLTNRQLNRESSPYYFKHAAFHYLVSGPQEVAPLTKWFLPISPLYKLSIRKLRLQFNSTFTDIRALPAILQRDMPALRMVLVIRFYYLNYHYATACK